MASDVLSSKPFLPWSHSRLKQYETCPLAFYHKYIAKDVSDPPGAAAQYGTQVHLALEERVRDAKPLPLNFAQYERYASALAKLPGKAQVELKLGMTEEGDAAAFDAPGVWGRGVIDVLKIDGATARVIDYKTGRSDFGTGGQDARNAALVFASFSQVMRVRTRFVYFKDGKVAAENYERADMDDLLEPTRVTLENIQWSYGRQNWPPKPSGLCGWCPVQSCTHWRPRKDRT